MLDTYILKEFSKKKGNDDEDWKKNTLDMNHLWVNKMRSHRKAVGQPYHLITNHFIIINNYPFCVIYPKYDLS